MLTIRILKEDWDWMCKMAEIATCADDRYPQPDSEAEQVRLDRIKAEVELQQNEPTADVTAIPSHNTQWHDQHKDDM